MFKVVRGDPKKLKGKAVIYTHNVLGDEETPMNPLYPALFVAANAEDLHDIMKHYNPPPEASEFIKYLRETTRKTSDRIERLIDEGLVKRRDIPERAKGIIEGVLRSQMSKFYSIHQWPMCMFNSEENIEQINEDGDIGQLTDSPGITKAISLLNSGAELYLDTYFAQRELLESGRYVKRFIDMTPEEFSSELIKVTGQLMSAMETDMNTDREYRALRRMVEDHPVMGRKMEEYIGVLQSNDPQKIPISEQIVLEMIGIATENFEQAAEAKIRKAELKDVS